MAQITNQVLWRRVLNHVAADLLATVTPANLRGIIPVPHNATRIDRHLAGVVAGTSTLYEVLADTILFIDAVYLVVQNNSADANRCYLKIQTAVPADRLHLLTAAAGAGQGSPVSNQYRVAVEAVAGEFIVIESLGANVFGYGGFSGWLEAV